MSASEFTRTSPPNRVVLIGHVLAALGVGAIVVVMPLDVLALVGPIVVLVTLLAFPAMRNRWIAGTWLVVIGAVALGAAAAPVKDLDRQLDQTPLTLRRTTMSVRELAEWGREIQPRLHVSEELIERDGDQTIQFPSSRPTLRAFIQAINTQTNLQCEGGGRCGNGATILRGTGGYLSLSLHPKSSIPLARSR